MTELAHIINIPSFKIRAFTFFTLDQLSCFSILVMYWYPHFTVAMFECPLQWVCWKRRAWEVYITNQLHHHQLWVTNTDNNKCTHKHMHDGFKSDYVNHIFSQVSLWWSNGFNRKQLLEVPRTGSDFFRYFRHLTAAMVEHPL